MLHEILLSLSGHDSLLLQQAVQSPTPKEDYGIFSELSPPEQALLAKLAHISELHRRIKAHTNQTLGSHTSVICRAVSSTIVSVHLKQLRQKVVEVENSILSNDAGYVGGYEIVPLSTIVGDFAPWSRRLEWLWKIVQFICPKEVTEASGTATSCSGAAVIDYLRRELSTGYEDIHEMAVDLVTVAEMAWLRQLSSWLLYGKVPAYSEQDFFICQNKSTITSSFNQQEFSWEPSLVPEFVMPATIQSIIFIGRSLNHIRAHSNPVRTLHDAPQDKWPNFRTPDSMNKISVTDMIPKHVGYLNSLTHPMSTFALSSAVSAIRLSVSQDALSQLLPMPKIMETLDILHDFLLLGRGEFAMSLIVNADRRSRTYDHGIDLAQPVRRAGRLDNIAVKQGEVSASLKQTWTDLASLQDEAEVHHLLDIGRKCLYFSMDSGPFRLASGPAVVFDSFLFPTPTLLLLRLSPESPLKLFLSEADVRAYAVIHAYLITIRRADMHLSSLWKLSPMRRNHPCPLGPPKSSTQAGKAKLLSRRHRDSGRGQVMRRYWATASKALFVMSELSGYFQGEVIKNHWEHLQNWIRSLRPDARSSSSAKSSRPGTASSIDAAKSILASSQHSAGGGHALKGLYDPATLAQAQQAYHRSLISALLLTHSDYVSTLRELLTAIDHFVALFDRLLSVQEGLDLQEDNGVMDALANYALDEKEIVSEMDRSRETLEDLITVLVEKVRKVDEQRVNDDMNGNTISDVFGELSLSEGAYVPWQGRTMDRLVMRLEFLAGESVQRGQDDEGGGYPQTGGTLSDTSTMKSVHT